MEAMPLASNPARSLALAATLAACSVATAAGLPATYRLQGAAQVSAPPVERSVEVHADATLRGAAPGAVTVTLAAEGVTCEVLAHADATGALRFDAGQRCAIDLRSPDARGHLDVALRSGTGHLDDDRLRLDLTLDVAGAIAMRTAARVDVLGRDVDLPSTWLPEAPVHGRAHAVATGRRDRSRAAGSP